MVLIIHLTFHEDVVVTIWANQEVRAALLSAARLLDRTDTLAVDEPGRASTRLEALTALHNLTFAQDNLAPLWQDEELRSVVVAAAASTCREDRQYKEAGLKMLSNFLLEPSNLVPMQQHAQACAALEAAARTKGKKEMLRAVNTALEKLGRSPQPQPPPAAAALAEVSPAPPSAHLSGEQEVALPVVGAPAASLGGVGGFLGEVGLGGVGVAAEAETRWDALLEDFEEVLPEERAEHSLRWIEASATVRTLIKLLRSGGWGVDAQASQPSPGQAKLLEALLEHGWWLASQEADTAIEAKWAKLKRALIAALRAIAETRPCTFFYDLRCRDHLGDVASEDVSILDKPQRVQRILDAAKNVPGLPKVELVEATDTRSEEEVLELARLAHTDKYVTRQFRLLDKAEAAQGQIAASVMSGGRGDGIDTQATKGTRQAVVSGLSCVLRGVDAVLDGEAHLPFCCVRPPGHHVGRDGRTHDAPSQGFCFLNNVGIAAKYAVDKKGLSRVAVIDFDVHHGNGTEEILSSDGRFFFVSVHAFGPSFYPLTGAESPAQRNVVNVALTRGFHFADLLHGWSEEGVDRRLDEFQPQLILLSSGFDAHKKDLAEAAKLDAGDYFQLTEMLINLAWKIESCHGRMLSVLEGGYDCKVGGGLQSSTEQHLRALSRAPRTSSVGTNNKRGRDGGARGS